MQANTEALTAAAQNARTLLGRVRDACVAVRESANWFNYGTTSEEFKSDVVDFHCAELHRIRTQVFVNVDYETIRLATADALQNIEFDGLRAATAHEAAELVAAVVEDKLGRLMQDRNGQPTPESLGAVVCKRFEYKIGGPALELVKQLLPRIDTEEAKAKRWIAEHPERAEHTSGQTKTETAEVRAQRIMVFSEDVPDSADLVDLVTRLNTEHAKPENERRSDNEVARDFTGETPRGFPKAKKLLSRLRFAKSAGRVILR